MKIIEYNAKYKKKFIEFNTDWITAYFKLEEDDYKAFSNIETELEKGAMIYFALDGDTVLATCMTKPLDDDTWEICKLASNKEVNHRGAGSAVFEAAMNWAAAHGAKRLFLISNTILGPALHIYEKFGFHEVKLDNYEYDRGDIAFEKIL